MVIEPALIVLRVRFSGFAEQTRRERVSVGAGPERLLFEALECPFGALRGPAGQRPETKEE